MSSSPTRVLAALALSGGRAGRQSPERRQRQLQRELLWKRIEPASTVSQSHAHTACC